MNVAPTFPRTATSPPGLSILLSLILDTHTPHLSHPEPGVGQGQTISDLWSHFYKRCVGNSPHFCSQLSHLPHPQSSEERVDMGLLRVLGLPAMWGK